MPVKVDRIDSRNLPTVGGTEHRSSTFLLLLEDLESVYVMVNHAYYVRKFNRVA